MRRRLVASLALLLLALAPAAEAGEWPFGGGAGPMARGRDLYNLGILGAKAWDADREAPAMPMGGGRRSGKAAPAGGGDAGPNRLRIELLYPDGPAAKAGLAVGDVICGVGRRAFKEGALEPLAEALVKAESRKGELTLLVQKGDAGKPEKVEVSLPVGGKPMAEPTEDEGRQRLVDAALAWLAQRQQSDGGYRETLSGPNGAVVQASLAGLAWIAGGSTHKEGPYKDNVARAVSFVRAHVGKRPSMPGMSEAAGGRNWNQTNWGVAHAAIFLGELHGHAPDPELKRALIDLGTSLEERQEESGGWAHGPGGPNALGYVELNILTGLALAGIGLAGQAGHEVDEARIDRCEAFLQASSNGDGGVGYSDKPGQKGQGNIGRTAGCWLGYETLGRGKTDWGRKMGHWTERHVGDVLGGHASLMQHVLLAGVAAHALGRKGEKRFWDACERDLVLARAPDGSFQPRPWRETLSMGTNSDVTFGEVWTTAAWTIVLACKPEKKGRPGLPYWMGLERTESED